MQTTGARAKVPGQAPTSGSRSSGRNRPPGPKGSTLCVERVDSTHTFRPASDHHALEAWGVPTTGDVGGLPDAHEPALNSTT